MGVVDDIDKLRRTGQLDEALMLVKRSLDDAGKAADADLLQAAARVMVDFGHYGAAARHLRAAYKVTGDAWIDAERIRMRHEHRVLRDMTQRGTSDDALARANHTLGRRIERAEAQDEAAFLCARAHILRERHPDVEASVDEMDAVRRDLDAAETVATDDRARRAIDIVRLKANRALAANAVDRRREMLGAIMDLRVRYDMGAAQPTHLVDYDDLRDVLDYEEGRLRLFAQDAEAAIACFDRVLQRRPGHQAAATWRIHAYRFHGTIPRSQLIRAIGLVLNDVQDQHYQQNKHDQTDTHDTRHLEVTPNAVRVDELRAELLAVRGWLWREQNCRGSAIRDFTKALEHRRTMINAARGLSYCHLDAGDWKRARRIIERLDKHLASRPVELHVDLGRLAHLDGDYDGALRHYDHAIRRRPVYGFAYEAKIRLCMARREHDEASVCFAAARAAGADGLDGVEVEHASTLLVRGHFNHDADDHPMDDFTRQLERIDEIRRTTMSGRVRRQAVALQARMHFDARDFRACRRAAEEYGHDTDLREISALATAELGGYRAAWRRLDTLLSELDASGKALEAARVERSLGRMWRALGQPTRARSRLASRLQAVEQMIGSAGSARPFRLELGRLHIELGWAALDLDQPDAAIVHFHNALALDELNFSAARGWILALGRKGEPDLAIETATHWLHEHTLRSSHPHVTAALWTDVGRVLMRCGRTDEGFDWFERANHRSFNFVQRTVQVAALIDAGLHNVAAAQLERMKALPLPVRQPRGEPPRTFRDDHAVVLLEGWISFVRGDSGTAEEVYGRLPQRTDGNAVIDAHDQPAHPGSGDEEIVSEPAVLGRAATDIARGQQYRALERLKPLVHPSGSDPAPPSNALATELMMWARIRAYERELKIEDRPDKDLIEKARKDCAHLRYLEPHRLSTVLGMGFVAAHAGDLGDAAGYLTAALRHPDTAHVAADGHRNAHQHREGQPSAAQRRAAAVYRHVAALHLHANALDEARDAVDLSLEHNPFDARSCLLKGVLLSFGADDHECLVWLRRSFQTDPSDPDAATALASILSRNGRRPEARSILADGLATVPERSRYRLHLALARIHDEWAMSDATLKRRLLRRARVNTDDAQNALPRTRARLNSRLRANVAYHRGIIQYHRGRAWAARHQLTIAINHDPHNDVYRRARDLMQPINVARLRGIARRLISWSAILAATALWVWLMWVPLHRLRADIADDGAVAALSAFGAAYTVPVLLALAFVAIVGFGMRRLTSVKLASVVEIAMDPGPLVDEPIESKVGFGELPLLTISGPTAQRLIPFSPDTDVDSSL